jgi:hypothetical protein
MKSLLGEFQTLDKTLRLMCSNRTVVISYRLARNLLHITCNEVCFVTHCYNSFLNTKYLTFEASLCVLGHLLLTPASRAYVQAHFNLSP